MTFRKRLGQTNYMTPIAIVIAGIIIAIAVVYTNGGVSSGFSLPTGSTDTADAEPHEYQKYIDVAKELGLNEKEYIACMDEFNTDELKKDLSDATSYGATGTPTFFIGATTEDGTFQAVKLVGAQPYETFQPVIDSLIADGNIDNAIAALPEAQQVNQDGTPVEPIAISIDDDAIRGDKNAKVTIVEFSDYECPFCKRYFESTYTQITSNYIDNGNVRYVFRDLPLSFHDPVATEEAVAANCAREVGGDEAYFQYHDEIFIRTGSNKEGI